MGEVPSGSIAAVFIDKGWANEGRQRPDGTASRMIEEAIRASGGHRFERERARYARNRRLVRRLPWAPGSTTSMPSPTQLTPCRISTCRSGRTTEPIAARKSTGYWSTVSARTKESRFRDRSTTAAIPARLAEGAAAERSVDAERRPVTQVSGLAEFAQGTISDSGATP